MIKLVVVQSRGVKRRYCALRIEPSITDSVFVVNKSNNGCIAYCVGCDFLRAACVGVDRLDYLQDTFLGLVNIQQNKIIKIFTVVSVIFLPPTLIASMYGMNFDFMPELHWRYGYLFAIFLMIAFASAILLVFKKKRWL